MTRPVQVEGRDPVYTREALEARIQGLMIVKCVITIEGRLENCRIIKPLPHMEKAVLDALSTRRYKPVTYQGRPVAVDYVFNIKLVMPNR
jgi:protein TonB